MPVVIPMIPLALLKLGLEVLLEVLRAWNNLPAQTRGAVVDDMLKDKQARDAAWNAFWGRLSEGWTRIQWPTVEVDSNEKT
jgi:hypothetical protein